MKSSNIQNYFSRSTVFVTGATGFLGRLLIEKLLRTCSDLDKVYILVRSKKGITSDQRFREYFNDPLYDRLKKEKPETMSKLHTMEGDCSLPDLGLSEQDRQVIISEVNCIFHVAATVRFNENLKTATYINVRGTRDILKLAKAVKDLWSVVYVSTAYSFCPRKTIEEVFYEPGITGDKLLMLLESSSEDIPEKTVSELLGDWPNTYTFSKSVAEDVIKKEGNGLPIALVRPSIVVPTSKEPVGGWANNPYGAIGMFVKISLGLIHTVQCARTCICDLVPADYVVNTTIAAAWSVGNDRDFNFNKETSMPKHEHDSIPIYNCVSSVENPIAYRDGYVKSTAHLKTLAFSQQAWHDFVVPTSNKYLFLLLHYALHIIPAYVVDFLAICSGKKPKMVRSARNNKLFLDVTAYFTTRQWVFRNTNTQKLWKTLNKEDQRLFEFHMTSLDWDKFFYTAVKGMRVYILNDPLDTLPEGQARRSRLKTAHYTLTIVLIAICLLFIWNLMI